MLIQHSVDINGSIEAVSSAFARGARKWFPNLARSRVAGVGFQPKVTVEIGEQSSGGSWTEVPITWRATYIKRLFPVMTGTVNFSPVNVRMTRLNVCGVYTPPLDSQGKHFDDALMHRVADATVEELAESIAKRLDAVLRS